MPKNLVLIHLDYLSQADFWHFRKELATFWRLQNESVFFRNCHAAGSSTIFTYASALLGTVTGMDHYAEYSPETNAPLNVRNGLFQYLREKHGYASLSAFVCDFAASYVLAPYHPGQFSTSLVLNDYPRDFFRLGQELTRTGTPFALYTHIFLDMHHIPYFACPEEHGVGDDVVTSLKERVRLADQALERILALLAEVLDDTILVVFGDHGSDYYGRKFNDHNTTRGTRVLAHNTWVPMLIRDSDLKPDCSDALASLVDLPPTILGRLFPEQSDAGAGALFPGIDLFREKRRFAFCQNKFALQNEYARSGESRKSYAVMEDGYRLIVNSHDPKTGRGGMELYLDSADPGNDANLMQLFELDAEGRVVDYVVDLLNQSNITALRGVFNLAALAGLARRYETMREALMSYVRTKEKDALILPGAQSNILSPESFVRVEYPPGQTLNLETEYRGIRWLREQKRRILLFGRTVTARQTIKLFRFHHLEVIGIIDNAAELWGTEVEGLPVISPEQAASMQNVLCIGCVLTEAFNKEIRKQCEALGFEYYSLPFDILMPRRRKQESE